MDGARKALGKRIKAARRAAGYKSARAFAIAIGVSEGSVARAETGDPKIGQGVYFDIETGLSWPPGSIEHYLDTGDEADLPPVRPRQSRDDELEPRDDFERKVLATKASRADKAHYIRRHRAALVEEARLLAELDGSHTDGASEDNDLGTHA